VLGQVLHARGANAACATKNQGNFLTHEKSLDE
jgi:hypothetical protein